MVLRPKTDLAKKTILQHCKMFLKDFSPENLNYHKILDLISYHPF